MSKINTGLETPGKWMVDKIHWLIDSNWYWIFLYIIRSRVIAKYKFLNNIKITKVSLFNKKYFIINYSGVGIWY